MVKQWSHVLKSNMRQRYPCAQEPCHNGIWGKQRYSSTNSYPHLQMAVKGQFYVLADLLQYQLVRKVDDPWAWTQRRRKNVCPWGGSWTPISQSSNLQHSHTYPDSPKNIRHHIKKRKIQSKVIKYAMHKNRHKA